MTLNDVRQLAAKGSGLQVNDFLGYRVANVLDVDSLLDRYTVVYDVQGGHRLYIRANPDGLLETANFECMGQITADGIKNGIGIDIRYSNLDEYLLTYLKEQ
jgi:hypothetical protein